MRLLLIGDVVGETGRRLVERLVPELREEHDVDMVVANGENAARGLGLTPRLAKELWRSGVDGITLGNHAFRHSDLFPVLNTSDRIIRPANVARKAPGKGLMFLDAGTYEVAVLNVMGSLYLDTATSMFEMIDDLVGKARARTPVVVIDVHAEATSEKVALGHYLNGRVSAIVGTHTHVQTSDARILSGGTAYMTDLGMTGPHDSVIGVRAEIILRKFTTGIGQRFEPATGGAQLEGALVDIDESTGRARSIESIRVAADDLAASAQ